MKEKPYAFALLTALSAVIVAGALGVWAESSPELVVIGLPGRHDGTSSDARLATCLDCHVPFVGTPGSRCVAPGCHSDLATGTPPREGKAMPVRFHVALRDKPCVLCHAEHGEETTRTSTGTFAHARIPPDVRADCARCHRGAGVPAHSSTDGVTCGLCHATEQWTVVTMDHRRVAHEPCDLCHVAPTKDPHASIAGTCNECHSTETWKRD